jgi:hypothetical protein
VEGERPNWQELEVLYAMMSVHLHIPFPEELPEETFLRKLRHLEWAMMANHLPVKLKENSGSFLPGADNKITDGEEN